MSTTKTVKVTMCLPGKEITILTSPFRTKPIKETENFIFATDDTKVWKFNHVMDNEKHAIHKANQVNARSKITLEHWTECEKAADDPPPPPKPKPLTRREAFVELRRLVIKARKTKADKELILNLTARLS